MGCGHRIICFPGKAHLEYHSGSTNVRKGDPDKNLPFSGSVQLRRLTQLRRQTFKILCQQVHRHGGEGGRQPHGPGGLQQTQPPGNEKVGDQGHLPGEKKQDHIQEQESVPELPSQPGKAPGGA